MREVEKRIIELLKSGTDNASLSLRDSVEIGSKDCGENAVYRLHGSQVAVYSRVNKTLLLGVPGRKWSTVTTKSRINAIAGAFGVPHVWQENFWWAWSDGVPYEGVREFHV